MKNSVLGFLALLFVAAVLESNLSGCSSNNTVSPTPVTVVQPSNPCSGTWGYGVFGAVGTQASAGKVFGSEIAISSASSVTARGIDVYVDALGTAGDMVRAAVYADSSGPTTVIVQSAPQTIVQGAWNEISLPSTAFSAGNYWVCIQFQNVENFYYSTTGGLGAFQTNSAYTWGNFPATMPATGGVASNFALLAYLTTCP